jgi:hypothetical protein
MPAKARATIVAACGANLVIGFVGEIFTIYWSTGRWGTLLTIGTY